MPQPAEELINEVRLLYQSLVQVTGALHQDSPVSVGMRAVLEFLDRQGATTVPDIARARRVTRQRIQSLVNPLIDLDLVTPVDNPASQRSPLIKLTKKGAKTILEMRRKEGRLMKVDVSTATLQAATDTLRQVRQNIESGS